MRENVKRALRITSAAFDAEIDIWIASARADLMRVGVSHDVANKDNDPLVTTAIIWYCKAHFGFDNPDAERTSRVYEACRSELSLSSGYQEEQT